MVPLKVTVQMNTPILFRRRPPSLDGILANEIISQGGITEVDVAEVLAPYLKMIIHPGVHHPIPMASQMLFSEDATWVDPTTIIGSFANKYRQFLSNESLIPNIDHGERGSKEGILNKVLGLAKGTNFGANSYMKNSHSVYTGVLSREVFFFAQGDEDGIRDVLMNVIHLGAKRKVGNGAIKIDSMGIPDITVTDISDEDIWEYKTEHLGLIDNHGQPVRSIPMTYWSNVFGSSIPKEGFLLDESYFPPYYSSRKEACWSPHPMMTVKEN